MLDDTIAAIATPLGEGGLAVIRLSGPEALAVADRSFVPVGKHSAKPSAATTHTIHYGKIMRQNRLVDLSCGVAGGSEVVQGGVQEASRPELSRAHHVHLVREQHDASE